MSQTISHEINNKNFNDAFEELRRSILAKGDNDRSSAKERLEILEQLKTFELGRFLIVNKGMNGFWTHYVCTWPNMTFKNDKSELELFLLEKRPLAVATQERFQIFLKLAQEKIRPGVRMASVPSGVMGDLLLLDFSQVSDFKLTAIDIDSESLEHARNLAESRGLIKNFTALQKDAWALNINNEFDIVSSSGLNIYVAVEEKILSLYRQLFSALKTGGMLITSIMTPPPWNKQAVSNKDLERQQIIYQDILGFKGSNFRTKAETKKQLECVGFKHIRFYDDKAGIFPVVTAIR